MGAALAIRADLTAAALRRHARFEPNRRAALRMLALANALDGLSRADAARLAGMERQARRCAMQWCAPTPRGGPASATGRSRGAPSG